MPLPAPVIQAILPASLGMHFSPVLQTCFRAIERVCLLRGKRGAA
jgi:hypothetical protein